MLSFPFPLAMKPVTNPQVGNAAAVPMASKLPSPAPATPTLGSKPSRTPSSRVAPVSPVVRGS